jgi:spore coat protein H
MFRRILVAALTAALLCSVAQATAGDAPKAFPEKASELFNLTTVWTVHLKFKADQWDAMEPKDMGRGIFGGGPVRNNAEDFGPAMFLGGSFMRQGDENEDGKISRDEFGKLCQQLFREWDKDKSGKLNVAQLRAGLNATFTGAANAPGQRFMGVRLLGDQGKRNGLASAMGVEFDYVHADLEFEGKEFKDVSVRYKGNGTWLNSRASQKRSMKIDLNEFNKGNKLAGITKLNLHNNVTDASWMNEVLSHRLYRDAGVPAARAAYARVFVTVAGKFERKYLGLYSIIENIDKGFVKENIGSGKGAILKPVTSDLFSYLGTDWSKYQQVYDPKTELTAKQQKRIIDFCKLMDKADDAEFAEKVGAYIDLDEFARYMAVTVWLSTLDSILMVGQNYLVYLDPSSNKFQFIPWDLDHSFGQFFLVGTQEQRERLDIHHPWRGDNHFLERMFKVEEFKKLYLARMEDFSKDVFKPERFHKQVDDIAAAIRAAVKEESGDKLARLESVVAGETVEAGFGGPRAAQPPATQPGATASAGARGGSRGDQRPGRGGGMQIKPIKSFVNIRAQSVLEQLAGKPGLSFDPPPKPRESGPGGNFGPGIFLAPAFMNNFDADKDSSLTREEFSAGFAKWFEAWNTDNSGQLTNEQLRAGLNRDLSSGTGPFARPMAPAPPVNR